MTVNAQPDLSARTTRAEHQYRRGLFADALATLGTPVDPDVVPDTTGRVLVGRICGRLGDEDLARWWWLQARARDRDAPLARCYVDLARLGRGRFWTVARRVFAAGADPDFGGDDIEARTVWLCSLAGLASSYRDIDRAEDLLRRARALDHDPDWVDIVEVDVLAHADRRDAALALARELGRRAPDRHAAQRVALTTERQLGDTEAALAAAVDHAATCQDWRCAASAARALLTVDRPADALGWVRAARDRARLASPGLRRFLQGELCDVTWALGDAAAAARHAERAGPGFYALVAPALAAHAGAAAPPPPRRVRLSVPWVRQDTDTCSPATLTALARAQGHPADHDAVAAAICYGGTPYQRARAWAESAGLAVRPFVVTREAAWALLDAGLPFALGTEEVDSAHVQPVVGYDDVRGTLLIQDPGVPYVAEGHLAGIRDHHAASGPTGFVLLPAHRADLLARVDALDLPDAALLDALHAMDLALDAHRPDEARGHLARAEATVDRPDRHPLLVNARRRLAGSVGDVTGELAAARRLTELCPDSDRARADLLRVLQRTGRTGELRDRLTAACADPGVHPAFLTELAELQHQTPAALPEAANAVRRALRRRPTHGPTLHLLGDILWQQRAREQALTAYRLAATATPTHEHYAHAVMVACRALGRADEGLDFLRARVARLGDRDGGPADTLADALADQGHADEALTVLQAQAARRPDDGAVQLALARRLADLGRIDEAEGWLATARGGVGEQTWRHAAVEHALRAGDHAGAAEHAARLYALAPDLPSSWAARSNTLERAAGLDAALDFLDGLCADRPRDARAHRLLAETLAQHDDPARRERALRRVCALAPDDAWAWRDLGFLLVDAGRLDEARSVVERAAAADPIGGATLGLRGALHRALGELDAARQALRAALEREPDYAWAQIQLIACCPDPATRREAVAFIEARLAETLDGAGVHGFADLAWRHLPADEALATIEALRAARPDLPATWRAALDLLAQLGRTAQRIELAERAAEAFPTHAGVALDRARAHLAAGPGPAARAAAAERAVALAPDSDVARCLAGEVLELAGDVEGAEQAYREAARRSARSAVPWGHLAELLWRRDDDQAAIDALERAVTLDPHYSWAWARLVEWGGRVGRAEGAIERLDAVYRTRPDRDDLLHTLVWALDRTGAPERALEHLDAARERHPRHARLRVASARALVALQRHDEAAALLDVTDAEIDDPQYLAIERARLEAQLDGPQAVRRLQDWLARHPHAGGAARALVLLLRDTGAPGHLQVEAAEAWCRAAPDDPEAHAQHAHLLLAGGDPTRGADALERALRLDPHDQRTPVMLADAYADARVTAGEIDRAARFAQTLDTPVVVLTALGRALLAASNPERAQRLLERALALEPAHDPARCLLFDIASTSHLADEPLSVLGDRPARADASPWLLARAMERHERLGRFPDAVGLANRVLRASPAAPWAIVRALDVIIRQRVSGVQDILAAMRERGQGDAEVIGEQLCLVLGAGQRVSQLEEAMVAWFQAPDRHPAALAMGLEKLAALDASFGRAWAQRLRPAAARHVRLWEAVGFALMGLEGLPAAAAWFDDDHGHRPTGPHLYHNHCLCLIYVGDVAGVDRVARAGLADFPGTPEAAYFATLVAVGHALQDRHAQAWQLVADLDPDALEPWTATLRQAITWLSAPADVARALPPSAVVQIAAQIDRARPRFGPWTDLSRRLGRGGPRPVRLFGLRLAFRRLGAWLGGTPD
ncbi:MAG: tetratricopeptide repeat protein [Myxococcales bacterium]|nr:tetratricopeptide repeat protein [Myxococcales bacterium]